EGFLERPKLRAQHRLDAGAGFVTRPETVAGRLDDVVGGDADVCRTFGDHFRNRVQHAGDGAEGWIRFLEATDAVEMAKQFVGAVDEMNDHSGVFAMKGGVVYRTSRARCCRSSINL